MKKAILIVVFFCSVAHLYGGSDDGRRCSYCGRPTLIGGSHICLIRKERNCSQSTKADIKKADSNRDLITGRKLSEMQKTLPPLDGMKVLGIEICRDYAGARPCLKVSGGLGLVKYYELRSSEYSYKQKEYDKAKAYYDKNVLLLPLLPTIKGKQYGTQEDFDAEIRPIINDIMADRKSAQDTRDKISRETKAKQQKNLALYMQMKGLFGRDIFQMRVATDEFSDTLHGGEYVKFKSGDKEFSDWECFYSVTPKQLRIYEISARRRMASGDEVAGVLRILENRYGVKFSEADDGRHILYGVNEKGNSRTLSVSSSKGDMMITLTDSAGRNLAEKEGSLVVKYQKQQEEEKLAYAPIAIWPADIVEVNGHDAVERNVWVVHMETLQSARKRISAGDDPPRIPMDGLASDK